MKAAFLRATRAAALLLLAAVLTLSLTSCVDKVGTGSVDTTTVLKIGDYKVTMDEYRYLCYKYKASMEAGDSGYFAAHPEAEAKLFDAVLRELCAIYAVYSLADEADLELTEAQTETLNQKVQGYIDSAGGEDAYFAAMQPYHMTGDQVWREETYTLLQQLLYARLTDEARGTIPSDDATIEAAIAAGDFFCVRYFCVLDNTTNKTAGEASRAYAESLRSRLLDGVALETVVSDANAALNKLPTLDYYLVHSDLTHGEYLIKGYLDENAERTVLALPEGGYSEVVEIDGSFFVYQRMASDDAYMKTSVFGDLRTLYQQRTFSERIAQRAAALYEEITFKKAYTGAFSVQG